jgi:hypothetical protein
MEKPVQTISVFLNFADRLSSRPSRPPRFHRFNIKILQDIAARSGALRELSSDRGPQPEEEAGAFNAAALPSKIQAIIHKTLLPT